MTVEQALQQAINAFMGSRFDEAAQRLLPLAQAGEVDAQKYLARLYFSGNGVEKNHQQYAYWLEQAALQGDRQSKIKLKRLKNKK